MSRIVSLTKLSPEEQAPTAVEGQGDEDVNERERGRQALLRLSGCLSGIYLCNTCIQPTCARFRNSIRSCLAVERHAQVFARYHPTTLFSRPSAGRQGVPSLSSGGDVGEPLIAHHGLYTPPRLPRAPPPGTLAAALGEPTAHRREPHSGVMGPLGLTFSAFFPLFHAGPSDQRLSRWNAGKHIHE